MMKTTILRMISTIMIFTILFTSADYSVFATDQNTSLEGKNVFEESISEKDPESNSEENAENQVLSETEKQLESSGEKISDVDNENALETAPVVDSSEETYTENIDNQEESLESVVEALTSANASGTSEIMAKGTYNKTTWTLYNNGLLVVEGTGDYQKSDKRYNGSWGNERSPWYKYAQFITNAQVNLKNVTDLSWMFQECENLETVDFTGTTTENLISTAGLFSGCINLTSANFQILNTSKVTNMNAMFHNCESLKSLDLSNFRMDKVTNALTLFADCRQLTSLDLSRVNAQSLTNTCSMFGGCENLTDINIEGLNTSQVKDMRDMFGWCKNLKSIDLSSMNTSSATTMSGMFTYCESLKRLDLSSFNTSKVKDMSSMFIGCSSLEYLDISSFTAENLEIVSEENSDCRYWDEIKNEWVYLPDTKPDRSMFFNLSNLKTLKFGKFAPTKVENFIGLFAGCSSLESLDLSSFKTTNATSMAYMFYGCSSLKSLDLSSFNTSNVTDMTSMFSYCSSLKQLDISNFDMTNVSKISHDTERYRNSQLSSGHYYYEDNDICSPSLFQGCSNLTTINLKGFKKNKIQDFSSMFEDCTSLKNVNIKDINFTYATDMSSMFSNCSSLQTVDMKSLNMPRVTTMDNMFYCCESLSKVDLTAVNTPCLVSTSRMFSNCCSISSIDMVFDTRNVKNMSALFYGCSMLESVYWDEVYLNKPTDISYMYKGCRKLKEIDLSRFDFKNIQSYNKVFEECGSLKTIKTPINVPGKAAIELPTKTDYFWLDQDDRLAVIALPTALTESHILISQITSEDVGKSTNMAYVHFDCDGNAGGRIINLDPALFENDSKVYNHDLARLSIALSTLAYSTLTEIKKSYAALGFENISTKDTVATLKEKRIYHPDDTNKDIDKGWFSPAWIAHKNVQVNNQDTSLIVLNIRGTYNTEWVDNFDPGLGETHAGFDRAAEKLADDLEEYLLMYDKELKENKILLITGHSRGAAVANLIGKKIDDKDAPQEPLRNYGVVVPYNRNHLYAIDSSKVFVYTFATPNVTRDEKVRDSKYGNIYNILNPEDFVTYVCMRAWGYDRYGKRYVLPNKNTDPKTYNQYLKNVQNCQKWYNTNAMYKPYKGGMGPVTEYVNGAAKQIKSISDYYLKSTKSNLVEISDSYPKTERTKTAYDKNSLYYLYTYFLGYYQAGAGFWSEENLTGVWNFAKGVAAQSALYQRTTSYFAVHAKARKEFHRAHEPESYLAMMDVVNEKKLTTPKYFNCKLISCPVDIEIVDADGKVVGMSTNNEEVSSEDDIYLELNGESKTIYLPSDQEYTIKATGFGEGTMEYVDIVYDEEGTEIRRTVYHDIPVEKGTVISEAVVPLSEENPEPEEIILKTEEGQPLEDYYKSTYEASELGKINIQVDVEGIGETNAFEELSPGDYITLVASTNGLNRFIGWYNGGKLLSSDAEFSFSVSESMDLTAKFTNNTEGMWALPIPEQEYSGSALKPEVKVYDGETLLKENTDYTVKYTNTTNVYELIENEEGFDSKKAPTITITGKGNYAKNPVAILYFTISPKGLNDEEISATVANQKYTPGKTHTSKPILKYGKITLKEGKDYSITNIEGDTKEEGQIVLTLEGLGNYTGERTVSYEISGFLYNLSSVNVKAIPNQVYTGEAITPQLEITRSKTDDYELYDKIDYRAEYSNNTNVGTATITLTGINSFAGSSNKKTVKFKIEAKSIECAKLQLADAEIYYTGTALKPKFTLTDDDTGQTIPADCYSISYLNTTTIPAPDAAEGKLPAIKVTGKKNYKGTKTFLIEILPKTLVNESGLVEGVSVIIPDILNTTNKNITVADIKPIIKDGKKVLVKDKDYSVAWTPQNRLTQNVTISFKGNYAGEYESQFKLHTEKLSVSDTEISLENDKFVYTGGKISPKVTVKMQLDGETKILTEGKDYKVSYSNNVNGAAKDSAKAPTVKIAGTGLYTGTNSVSFTISPRPISAEEFSVTVDDILYTGKEVKPKVTVTDKTTGAKLAANNYTVMYQNNVGISDDSPQVVIEGKGANYKTAEEALTAHFRIYKTDISKMTFAAIDSVYYTGKSHRPDRIKVYADSKKTMEISNDNYELSYEENIKTGKGTVYVKGTGEYGGIKKLNFLILPKWIQWFMF